MHLAGVQEASNNTKTIMKCRFAIITYAFTAVKIFGVENLALSVFHLTLWGLALVGTLWGRQQNESWLPTRLTLCSVVLYGIWFLPFVGFIGHSPYTFGTIPFLSILAARWLACRRSRYLSRKQALAL